MLIMAQQPQRGTPGRGSTPAQGDISMERIVWVLLISSAC